MIRAWINGHSPVYIGRPLDPLIVGVIAALLYLFVMGALWVAK